MKNRKQNKKIDKLKKAGSFFIISEDVKYTFVYNPCYDKFYIKKGKKLYIMSNEVKVLEAIACNEPYLRITIANPDEEIGEHLVLFNK